MQVALLGVFVLVGSVIVASLWSRKPMLAVVCAPFIASLLTGLAAWLSPSSRKPTRRGFLPRRP